MMDTVTALQSLEKTVREFVLVKHEMGHVVSEVSERERAAKLCCRRDTEKPPSDAEYGQANRNGRYLKASCFCASLADPKW